jgi:hypothetical protein
LVTVKKNHFLALFSFSPSLSVQFGKENRPNSPFLGILPLLLRFAWFLPSPELASMETAAHISCAVEFWCPQCLI